MSKHTVSWEGLAAHEEGAPPDDERILDFEAFAQHTLRDLRVDSETLNRVSEAGCRVEGVRYCDTLFSDSPEVDHEDRIKSAFFGAVAHGRQDVAEQAYSLLLGSGKSPDIARQELLSGLERAMRKEARHGSLERMHNLESAANSLGRSLHTRIIGSLAVGFHLHARMR